MAFVAHSYTVEEIISRAALLMGEGGAIAGTDTETRLKLFAALNEFIQGVARSRNCWWLQRTDGWLATVVGQRAYRIRQQARGAVTFSGVVTDGDTVTVGSRAYEFDDDSSSSGDVDVTIGTTAAECAEYLASAINGDADRTCGARAVGAVCYLYWCGTDGVGQTLTDTTDSGSTMTITAFAYHLADFSRLMGPPQVDGWPALRRCWASDRFATSLETDGLPVQYCVDGAADGLQLYSSTWGGPDDIYPVRFAYYARPSAILPDGRGDLDFPEEFHDILPHAVKLLYHAGQWNEAAVYGDEWMQRRLAELDRFNPDASPLPDLTPACGASEPAGAFEVYPPLIY